MIDFFNPNCQHPPTREPVFGLRDCNDNNISVPAYPDFAMSDKWIAKVINEHQLDIIVTSIDKCVILDNQLPNTPRCDAMLTTDNILYLVELKNKGGDWISEAVNQLRSTANILQSHHPTQLQSYKLKKAFACNKRRPQFKVIQQEEQHEFYYRSGGFRLDLQATVVIVE